MYTARYGLIPYIKQITFLLLKVNPLNAELNPICHLLALLAAHYILHVSRIRVKPENIDITNVYSCACRRRVEACLVSSRNGALRLKSELLVLELKSELLVLELKSELLVLELKSELLVLESRKRNPKCKHCKIIF